MYLFCASKGMAISGLFVLLPSLQYNICLVLLLFLIQIAYMIKVHDIEIKLEHDLELALALL